MTEIKLSSLEAKIIRHRLDVPDCLADALDGDFERDDIYDAMSAVRWHGLTLLIDGANPIAVAILRDCIEGSTYLAASDKPDRPVVRRAQVSIVAKARQLLGYVAFPGA